MSSRAGTSLAKRLSLAAAGMILAAGVVLAASSIANAAEPLSPVPDAATGRTSGSPDVGAASRGVAPTPIPHGARVSPLTLAGFDETTAAANGFVIVELASGATASVPLGSEGSVVTDDDVRSMGGQLGPGGGASTQDYVYGDCGFSYVWMYPAGYRAYEETKGWDVTLSGHSAVWHNWQAPVFGPGLYHQNGWNEPIPLRQRWGTSLIRPVPRGGLYTAYLYGGFTDYVILSTGGICTSAPTSSGINIP